jgi:sugar fermentation stimulation protein A
MEVKITFSPPLIEGILVQRYKRFLADVKMPDGKIITAVCPNTGSMKTCCEPGRPVALSYHAVPTRKYAYTWEMIKMDAGWVGVNTGLPNLLVAQAVQYGMIPELTGYSSVRREVAYGLRSRVDLLLEGPGGRCYVEIKNVSLLLDGCAAFPDAVTERGAKHLDELMKVVKTGDRAVMLFLVQRPDGNMFRPADAFDPVYGQKLREAKEKGVEILVYRAIVSPQGVSWGGSIEKDLKDIAVNSVVIPAKAGIQK